MILTNEEAAAANFPLAAVVADLQQLGGTVEQPPSSIPPVPSSPIPTSIVSRAGRIVKESERFVEHVVTDIDEVARKLEDDVKGIFGRNAGDISQGPGTRV